jgi:hypothetical protein
MHILWYGNVYMYIYTFEFQNMPLRFNACLYIHAFVYIYSYSSIYAHNHQEERISRFKSFKEFNKRILVSTDLFGRGKAYRKQQNI